MTATLSFQWQVRIYYEDTDAGGVVYHSNYLKFMERARTEWLRHIGFERDALNLVFVVVGAQLQFKKPARLNDLITITSDVIKADRCSFELAQNITFNSTLLVQGLVKVACVHPQTFRPVAVPSELKLKMQFTKMESL